VQELFVRCDSLLAAFMHRCDSLVGPENYAVFVTADHGVGPIPEIIRDQARQQGAVIDAGRIRESQIAASLNTMLSKRYSTWDSVQWVREIYEPSIYLNYDVLSERHVNYDTLVQACVDHLASQPWVGIVTTKADLRRDKRPRDVSPELWTWLKNSFYADRYGDVVVYPKMYWVIGSAPATHGTPWIYDRMVPLMVLMPGAPNGGLRNKHDVFLDVSPVDIAPTIAAWYGLQLPSVDGKALPLECGK
jgi:hypothetical protein